MLSLYEVISGIPALGTESVSTGGVGRSCNSAQVKVHVGAVIAEVTGVVSPFFTMEGYTYACSWCT